MTALLCLQSYHIRSDGGAAVLTPPDSYHFSACGPLPQTLTWYECIYLSAHRVQSNLNVKSRDTDKATLSQLLFSVVSLLLKDFPVQMTFTTMSAARWTALPWVPVQTVGFRVWWQSGHMAVLPCICKIFLTYWKLCVLVGGQRF